MIIHEDTAPFGGRVSDIVTVSFKCVVSTAKEGIFKGLSTMVAEVDDDGGGRPCAKIIYTDASKKADRQGFHRAIAVGLDEMGEKGCSLCEAIEIVGEELKERGVVSEVMNLA